MRAHTIRVLSGLALLTSFTVLSACAEVSSRQEAAEQATVPGTVPAANAERVAQLTQELASVSRYAARMEEIYAAQEAEILVLRERVASLEAGSP